MKLYNINDLSPLIDLSDDFKGDVTFSFSDDVPLSLRSLKDRQLLRHLKPKDGTLNVRTENEEDSLRIIHYMMNPRRPSMFGGQ